MARRARRAREPTVACQQDGVEHLSKRDVHGVVGAQVLSKRPYSIEQRFMGVALQIQVEKNSLRTHKSPRAVERWEREPYKTSLRATRALLAPSARERRPCRSRR